MKPHEVVKKPEPASALNRTVFLLLRGLSSLCFVPPHLYAMRVIRHDPFTRYSMLVTMVCSLGWNNLAFAWPSFAPQGWPAIPRAAVLAASTLDGFGMVASSLCVLGHATGLYAAQPYPYWLPWAIAAAYALFEHALVGRSQGRHCPRFVGLSGATITKVHYPFVVHVVRSSVVGLAVFACGLSLLRAGRRREVGAMLAAMAVGFGTYMTNGYDRDFTCFRVWLWHGSCACFAAVEMSAMAMNGA